MLCLIPSGALNNTTPIGNIIPALNVHSPRANSGDFNRIASHAELPFDLHVSPHVLIFCFPSFPSSDLPFSF